VPQPTAPPFLWGSENPEVPHNKVSNIEPTFIPKTGIKVI
jgi:hypothetical protein